MAAQAAWLAYAGTFYILWAVGFRIRYRRWPVAYRLPPRTRHEAVYTLTDLGLNLSLISYTLWLLLGPPPAGRFIAPGLILVGCGAALRLWTVLTLGPNWRMGQDEADAQAMFVAAGPYRLCRHPINAALIIVAMGQALLTGLDARAWFLLVVAVAYYAIQARAEARFWRARQASQSSA